MSGTGSGTEKDSTFQLRGGSYTMMVLRLADPAAESFWMTLGEKVRQAPNFFRNAPVVLDLDGVPTAPGATTWTVPEVVARLRKYSLLAVGVQGGSRTQQDAAVAAGLAVMPAGRAGGRLEPPANAAPPGAGSEGAAGAATTPSVARLVAAPVISPVTPEPAVVAPPRGTLVVTEPVRSGRQVYAPGGDVVVTATVSAGGEVLADGSIHIYGTLRGRALAGLSGDTQARIFCMSLEAEMVSVAGLYRVSEDIAPSMRRKPVQIYLKEGYLCIESIEGVASSRL